MVSAMQMSSVAQQRTPRPYRSRGSEFKCRHGPTFPLKQYHRPHRLNGRVRNGNGCVPVGMGTDKNPDGRFRSSELVYFSTINTRSSFCPLSVVNCPLSVVGCNCN